LNKQGNTSIKVENDGLNSLSFRSTILLIIFAGIKLKA